MSCAPVQCSECRPEECMIAGSAGRLVQALVDAFFTAGAAIAMLCIPAILLDAAAEDQHDLEIIASKEWQDISNEEIIFVFHQYLGNKEIMKFEPGFCIGRFYYDTDDKIQDRIDKRILEFEEDSGLREYGYEIFANSRSCEAGNLMLGIFDNVYSKNSFLFRIEKELPFLVANEVWHEFKSVRHCTSVHLATQIPHSIWVGIGLIDLREQEYLGSLETCIDRVLMGSLGGLTERRGYFTRMGFSEETARRLATKFVRILYHPEIEYGRFKFREREVQITDILNAFRRRPGINTG